jgi:predicted lactoylglutathione lyase
MSTTETTTPRITREGTRAVTPRKLFVNIPVGNLQRSIDFFETLGFTFNRQFTSADTTCMLVGEDAYFMLLEQPRFAGFCVRPTGDPRQSTQALFAISVDSRDAVDQMVKTAIASGGAAAADPQDHGFMYGSSFFDPDGHHWEVFWMDPATVQQ